MTIGPDQLAPPPGSSEIMYMRHVEGDLLLSVHGDNAGLFKRVKPSDICKKRDGTYLEGAPHVAPSP